MKKRKASAFDGRKGASIKESQGNEMLADQHVDAKGLADAQGRSCALAWLQAPSVGFIRSHASGGCCAVRPESETVRLPGESSSLENCSKSGFMQQQEQTPPSQTPPREASSGMDPELPDTMCFDPSERPQGCPPGAEWASASKPAETVQRPVTELEVHPKPMLEVPASPMKAPFTRKRNSGERPKQHSSASVGLSTIEEEKDFMDKIEQPAFIDGTPTDVLRPLGRLGSLKVMTRKPAAMSAERRRLQHVLDFISEEQLRERLSLAVQSEDDLVERLAALLPEAMFPGKAENLEKCYLCDSLYDPTYTKGNMLFVCRGCMSQHRERESLDGRGSPTVDGSEEDCTGDEDCWCFKCMEKMPDEEEYREVESW